MTNEHWERARALFDALVDLPDAERRARLDVAGAGDAQLRAEVQALLDADSADDPQIEAVSRIATALEDAAGVTVDQALGLYQIDREIGHGGMGTVFLAHRNDDEFQRQVAIKVIRGFPDGEMVRRFRVERQILANLDHPNIARLIDGGTTPGGLPYLVMEYVEGLPVGEYCDANRLTVRDRVTLVKTLCRAVHYAHERGVVHRDIKPGNVLVTPDGVPKLLDFGIAHMFDASGAPGDAALTIPGTHRLTPEYASPEQALSAPVTTASDVYVLGLILYELLTGTRPQRPTTNRHEDVIRAITESTPPSPSDRARSTPTDSDACAARQTTPDRLARSLAGDLDRIVLKAISKEASHRYSSAASLADDLDRYLKGEPVHARAASLGYILRRRMARHGRVVAAAAIVTLLGVGQVGYWVSSRAAQQDAVDAAQRFGSRIERVVLELRIERGLPLHDTRQAKARVRAGIAEVEAQIAEARPLVQRVGYYAIGRGYLALDENTAAREWLTRAWEAGYQQPEVAMHLGLALGRLYQAQLLEISAASNPTQRKSRRAVAQAALRDPAVRFLRAGATDPDFGLYASSVAAFLEDDISLALTKAAEARQQAGWMYETLLLEGDVNLAEAVTAVTAGRADSARQSIGQARDVYAQASRVAPSDPVPYARLCALGAIRVGLDLDTGGAAEEAVTAAVEACRQGSVADPDLAQPYVDLARTYWTFGTYQRRHGIDPMATLQLAADSARQAISREPGKAGAYLHLGTALQVRGAQEMDTGIDPRPTFEAAAEAYRQAASRGLDDATLHIGLANAYSYVGDWERAHGLDPHRMMELSFVEYRKAAEREPDNPLPWSNLGIALKDLARYEIGQGRDGMPLLRESIAAYDAALQRNPNHAATLNNLANSWYLVGLEQFAHGQDPDASLQRADAAIAGALENNASYATPLVNRTEVGLVRAAAMVAAGGDPQSVIGQCRVAIARAITINPGRTNAHEHAARTALFEARWRLTSGGSVAALVAEARASAARILQLNPADNQAWQLQAEAALIDARWRMGQGLSPDAALATAQAAIDRPLTRYPDSHWFVETALEINLTRVESGRVSPTDVLPLLRASRDLAMRALARKADSFRIQALGAVLQARLGTLSSDTSQVAEGNAQLTSAIAANPYLNLEFQPYLPR